MPKCDRSFEFYHNRETKNVPLFLLFCQLLTGLRNPFIAWKRMNFLRSPGPQHLLWPTAYEGKKFKHARIRFELFQTTAKVKSTNVVRALLCILRWLYCICITWITALALLIVSCITVCLCSFCICTTGLRGTWVCVRIVTFNVNVLTLDSRVCRYIFIKCSSSFTIKLGV